MSSGFWQGHLSETALSSPLILLVTVSLLWHEAPTLNCPLLQGHISLAPKALFLQTLADWIAAWSPILLTTLPGWSYSLRVPFVPSSSHFMWPLDNVNHQVPFPPLSSLPSSTSKFQIKSTGNQNLKNNWQNNLHANVYVYIYIHQGYRGIFLNYYHEYQMTIKNYKFIVTFL